jgi:nucleotide-binding universal stress UspA family protein
MVDKIAVTSGREVVAVIEEATTAQRCLTVALRAAQRVNSLSLSALHICVDPAKLVAAVEEISLQSMREIEEGSDKDRLGRARAAFQRWATLSGAQVRWVEHVGGITSSLICEVKDAALIVIAQPHNLDSADALHAAIFNSHRLVLYVPSEYRLPPSLGEHMVVAWKPRRQARKAVIHAIPWLKAAKRVTIVIVSEAGGVRDCDEVLHLLDEHGISADIRGVSARKDEYIGARLLSEAEAVNADSLVMGAFRFGQIYEWLFGGVTYEVLNRTRLPVFMMH